MPSVNDGSVPIWDPAEGNSRYQSTSDGNDDYFSSKGGRKRSISLSRAETLSNIPPLVRSLSRRSFGVPNDKLYRRLTVFNNNELEMAERIDSLNLMRPFKLIGNAQRLINWEKKRTNDLVLKCCSPDIRRYYEFQNDLIDRYKEIDSLLDTGIHIEMIQNYADNTSSDSDDGEEIDLESQTMTKSSTGVTTTKKDTHRKVPIVPGNINFEGAKLMGHQDGEAEGKLITFAIHFTFILNFFLLIGKLVMIYFTNSFSLIASVVDSSLDFLSTLIIFFSNKYAGKQSSRFPVGRKQLEPLGVLVFSVVIIISFLQVFIESFRALIAGDRDIRELNVMSISVMSVTIGTKLLAWELFRKVKNSSIQALTEDAKTDVVFNTFSLIFPLIGWLSNLWFMDPLGACILCLYVIIQWAIITFEHIDHLSGSHAPKEYYQQVLYLIIRFTENISKVKNFKMYHMGDDVNVEVDIVVKNTSMTLKDYHDLGESLQYAIETLPYVNRCFVHIDYKVNNYLGHLQ